MCQGIREMIQEGKSEGEREGKIEGKREGKKEMALALAEMGMPMEKIAEAAKISVKTLQDWIAGSENKDN